MSTPQKQFPFWTAASLVSALMGNLVAAAFLVYPLLWIAPGSGVRLLWESFESFVASAATLIVVLILAIVALKRERHRIAAIVAGCIALTPFFFSGWAMRCVAALRGIVLEP